MLASSNIFFKEQKLIVVTVFIKLIFLVCDIGTKKYMWCTVDDCLDCNSI